MHSCFRSIGFKQLNNRKELNELVHTVIRKPSSRVLVSKENGENFIQISREIADGIGVTVIGEYDEDGSLTVDHAFPYVHGRTVTIEDEILVEKLSDKDAYAGYCDNYNVGITLIFYVSNISDKVKADVRPSSAKDKRTKVSYAGLSNKGSILFEIMKDEREIVKEKKSKAKRKDLLTAAKAGDMEAIDFLNTNDVDNYNMVAKRCRTEDIFTIVDSYFMPCGVESDHYSVLGTIRDVEMIVNPMSKEKIYRLLLECNDVTFDVVINTDDLLGEPLAGRRFKGDIWMQGKMEFENATS